LKLQGLEDVSEQQPYYYFIDVEYDDRIRIRIDAVPDAATMLTTRANVMYILQGLPITLMTDGYLAGVNFYAHYHDRLLYTGTLDDRNDPLVVEPANQTDISSQAATAISKKRAPNKQLLSMQANGTTTVFTIPGSNEQIELRFFFVGVRVPKVSIFRSVIELAFGLGLSDSAEHLESADISHADSPAWIFMKETPGSTFPFAVFHALAVSEAIVQHYAQQRIYREMVFDFLVDGVVVNRGCVTKPDNHRRWCGDLRRDRL